MRVACFTCITSINLQKNPQIRPHPRVPSVHRCRRSPGNQTGSHGTCCRLSHRLRNHTLPDPYPSPVRSRLSYRRYRLFITYIISVYYYIHDNPQFQVIAVTIFYYNRNLLQWQPKTNPFISSGFVLRVQSLHQNTIPFRIITFQFFLLHNTIAVT